MLRTITAIAAAVLLLAGCGDDTATTERGGPYERYLQIAPDGAPYLTRSEALVRAAFGCGESWDAPMPAPEVPFGGELDAALASVYGC